MDGVSRETWITTGEAAKLLGYSPEHFRNKFAGILPVFRLGKGNRRWLRSAVEKLVDDNTGLEAAG